MDSRSDETLPADAGQLGRGVRRTRATLPAVERVRRALRRLSRDRWLSSSELYELAHRLSECCSNRPEWTATSVMSAGWHAGMLRGQSPADPSDEDFKLFGHALHTCRPKQGETPELLILNREIRRSKQWKRHN